MTENKMKEWKQYKNLNLNLVLNSEKIEEKKNVKPSFKKGMWFWTKEVGREGEL